MQFVGPTGDFASGPSILPASPADYLNPVANKYANQVPVEMVAPPGMPPGIQYASVPMYQPYGGQSNGQGYFPMMYYPGTGGGQWQGGYIPQTYMPIDNSTYYAVDQHGNYILLPQQPGMPNTQMSEGLGNTLPPSHLRPEPALPENGPMAMPESMEADSKPVGPGFDDSHGRPNPPSLHRKNQKFRPNAVYKTLMCTMYEEHGRCTYGIHCQYAHGQEELRPNIPHPKYKTQMCNKFSTPHGCQYGDKCHFRHPDDPSPTFAQSHVQQRSGAFFEPAPNPNLNIPKPVLRNRNHKLQSGNAPPTHVPKTQNVSKHHSHNTPPKQFGISSELPPKEPSTEDAKVKETDCLIKLSMYHHFENYIGKNRKPATLARSNSCNTVSSFTFVRFVSMQKLVTDQVYRMNCKKNAIGFAKKDSLTTPQTPLTAQH